MGIGYSQLQVTELEEACRLVAASFYGNPGRWLYELYERLNEELFSGELPTALITIELTPHGKCLGLTGCGARPRIKIHPSCFDPSSVNPWNIDCGVLGWRFAADVMVHEMTHASVDYRCGGIRGPTSHDCPNWRSEVERIAPLVGLKGFKASRNKVERVPTGKLNDKGKPITKTKRVLDGELPYSCTFCFPYGARMHLNQRQFYLDGCYPFEVPHFDE